MREKEYLEIKTDHPYFKGLFSMAKLFLLIEKKEAEGWSYIGNKTFLKYANIRTDPENSSNGFKNIVAIMERERTSP